MAQPHLLITNDDGIQAPGLVALRRELGAWADVTVLAPEHNWSASGHSKTMHKPLRVHPARLADGSEGLACSGSPSDCVALALLGVIPQRPELVISGINVGANCSLDLNYSGTVSAAMEAYIDGISAIAISLDSHEPYDPQAAARFCAQLARQVLSAKLAQPVLLNVNVPPLPMEELRGVLVTRLGRRVYRDELVTRHDPRGRAYYWIGGEAPAGVPEEGTDIGALAAGYISVTPLHLDLTAYDQVEQVRAWGLTPPD